MKLIRWTSAALYSLFNRVTSGGKRGPNDLGGVGVASRLKPRPPVLVGGNAEPLPKD